MKLLQTLATGIFASPFRDECTEDWSNQVVSLRQEIKSNNLQGYLIPSEDAHLSEYVAPEYARRAYISGNDQQVFQTSTV